MFMASCGQKAQLQLIEEALPPLPFYLHLVAVGMVKHAPLTLRDLILPLGVRRLLGHDAAHLELVLPTLARAQHLHADHALGALARPQLRKENSARALLVVRINVLFVAGAAALAPAGSVWGGRSS